MKRVLRKIATFALACLIAAAPVRFAWSQAALVPNAEQTFLDQNGNPLSGGKVWMYVPNTTNRKTTWSDNAQTTQNTNPVILDAAGRAVIFGQGNYTQRVTDSKDVEQWSSFTSAYGSAEPSGATGTDTAPVGAVMAWAGMTVPTNWAYANGQQFSRVDYSSLLDAITVSYDSVGCTSGSAILTGWPDTSLFRVGAPVEASCIPTGTTVIAITSATTVTVSANATATETTTARVFPWGNGDGSLTFNAPDLRGYVPAGANTMGGSAATVLTVSTNLTTTSGSATATVASATGVYAGMAVVSSNVAAGTTVSSIVGTTVTLSAVATATSTVSASFQAFAGVNAAAATGGAQSRVMTVAQMPTHSHVLNDPGHTHNVPARGYAATGTGDTTRLAGSLTGGATFTYSNMASATTGITMNNTGSSAEFGLMQPTRTVWYIVKVRSNTTGAGGVVSLGGMFGDIACGTTITCEPIGSPLVNTIECTTATVGQLGCVRPDGTTVTIAGGVISAIAGVASQINVGITTIGGGTPTRVLYNNAGVLDEYTQAQLTAQIDVATASLSGALPAWPDNTTTFFRGDGTYATLNCASLTDEGPFCDGTNAANLTGTVDSARLSGSYTGITGVGTLTAGATGAGFTVALGTSTVTGQLGAANGGTGAATLTEHAVVLGNGTGAVGFATIGTAGRLLIDQGAAANPAFTVMSGDAAIAANGALTIANNAVTYAKFQQVAASSLVGNPTGSPADAQGITLGATLAFSGSALQTGALSGDVTSSANSFATTIANNAVTYAKFQQVAAASLVGNPTGGAADASGITLDTTLGFAGSVLGCTTATDAQIGCVRPDNSTITISGGVLTSIGGAATDINVGVTTVTGGSDTRVLFNNAGVLGEYAVSGSGNVAMTTSPSFTTPTLGVAAATTINKVTLTAPATAATLTIADGKTATFNNSITFAGTDSTTMTFPNASATIPRVVASGAKALATGAISSASCTSAQTDTATGTLTTDAISVSFASDPTGVTGYVPLVTGMLTIVFYPTADTVNFKVCNNTASSITPGAITINWRVIR